MKSHQLFLRKKKKHPDKFCDMRRSRQYTHTHIQKTHIFVNKEKKRSKIGVLVNGYVYICTFLNNFMSTVFFYILFQIK